MYHILIYLPLNLSSEAWWAHLSIKNGGKWFEVEQEK